VLYSLLIAIASMLADISYYLIDPRVRY
jgi:ABC-type dipeptide/oligopeptide/nickel transport system permease component